jgi:hypothetical protein
MKAKEIRVIRNFRTHNEDVYLKETRERLVELQDDEDANEVENRVVQEMIDNFKKQYPNLMISINFDQVIQRDKEREKDLKDIELQTGQRFVNGTPSNGFDSNKRRTDFDDEFNPSKQASIISTANKMFGESSDYKYPVATVETIIKEMQSYSLGASAFKRVYELQCKNNAELKKVFEEKLKELQTR